MFFLLYILVIVGLIYLWFKQKYTFWDKHGFVSVPGKIPMGSLSDMGFKEHSSVLMKRMYDQHKGKTPVLGLYFFANPTILPLEPEIIKDIFTRQFESFHERGFYVNERDDPLSGHLFNLSGERWKEMRAKLSPTFTSGKIKMMFGTVLKECDKMVDYLENMTKNQQEVQMKEILAATTTQVITSVAFGLETDCLGNPNNEFRQISREVFEPPPTDIVKFMIMSNFPKFAKFFKMRNFSKKSSDFIIGMVKNTIEHREKNNIHRHDFLQLLLEAKIDGVGMTINEMAAQAFIFLLAGFETSSSVAMFSLYELALNPEMQDRVRNEINEVLENYDNKVTYDSIFDMKYLDMIFKETLRKYPVVDVQIRNSTKDYQVPGTKLTIPAKTMILVSTAALHHDERFFENPDQFDPERFTPENEKNIPSYAYLPFSEVRLHIRLFDYS